MRYFNTAIFLIAILVCSAMTAAAQESQTRIVDEVVAQVNDSVITLSRINREMNNFINSLVQEGKTREQATAEVEAKRGEIIANLINEELLIQKAKETGLDSEVEAQVNQSFLQNMRELNMKSLDELYAAMTQNGVSPEDAREFRRREFTKDYVFQREVDARVYNGWKKKEIQAYYEANKSKFTKPETVTISEIYLSFAGNDPDAVRARAAQIMAQAKGGADFGKLAVENSDREDVKTTLGKAGTFNVKDMDEKFTAALKNAKVGDVVGPVELDNVGVEILRVDARQQASNESFYDEAEVRKTMTLEKIPENRKSYLVKLREDNYIKVNERYRAEVAPILYAEERKTKTEESPGK